MRDAAKKYASALPLAVMLLVIGLLGFMGKVERAKLESPIDAPAPQRALVTKVLEESQRDEGGVARPYQRVQTELLDGAEAGKAVEVEIGALEVAGQRSFVKAGDKIYVVKSPADEKHYLYGIDRQGSLLWLVALLAAAVLLVSRGRGAKALAGLAMSYLVITSFLMPRLAAGGDVVTTSLVAALLILGPTYLLSYGATKKTAIALGATVLAMCLSLALAAFFSDQMRLTGLTDEDILVYALSTGKNYAYIYQLMLVSMIIGVLGVLDDVIIAQVSTVFELAHADRSLGRRELFRRAMRVGNDHIASVVNTLMLAYSGASLPLFLYFTSWPQPVGVIVSEEIVATELVRMLVGTIGLVLAVPLATAMATLVRAPAESAPHRH